MKKYIGTKEVKGKLVTKQWYYDYRGWNLPDGDDPNEEIYLVEYEADPLSKPNHQDHKGYITFSPKHVFDKAYKVSETYLDRLAIEHYNLKEKAKLLEKALITKSVPESSIDILKRQLKVMIEYLDILNSRLEE